MTHPCTFCSKKPKNFSHHIFTKQHENEEVKEIQNIKDEKERKRKISKLRLRAAHEHNKKVVEEKSGEIYVLRRAKHMDEDSDDEDTFPEVRDRGTFDITYYGPCPPNIFLSSTNGV